MQQMTRRRVQRLAAALGAAVVPVGLAACGGTATPAGGAPSIGTKDVSVSFAPGSWGTRAGRKEATDAMLKEFGAKYPRIKIDVQLEAPSPTPNESWITRVVAGDVPDVVISSGALFEWMAKRNVWADMRPALQKLGWKQGDFFFNPNTTIYQGKQYAVPFVAHQGGVLVFNKTMFREAGVAEPTKDWTWDDVLEAAKKLTRPEKNQWGFNAADLGHDPFFAGVWAAGGEVIAKDFKQTLFAGPQGVEVMDFYSGLINRQRVSPTPAQRAADKLGFSSGNFAMEINTPGRQSDQAIAGKFDWDVTFFPRWKNKRRAGIVDWSEWAVTTAAQKHGVLEEATLLATYYTNEFTQGVIADISPAGTTPANKAVARSQRYLAPPPKNMSVIVDMLDGKDNTQVHGWPYFEYFQQWQLPIRNMIPRILNNEINVKDGLQQAAEQSDKDVAAVRT
jgi:multiple sugar transport system substrate-binding protein